MILLDDSNSLIFAFLDNCIIICCNYVFNQKNVSYKMLINISDTKVTLLFFGGWANEIFDNVWQNYLGISFIKRLEVLLKFFSLRHFLRSQVKKKRSVISVTLIHDKSCFSKNYFFFKLRSIITVHLQVIH